MGIAQSREFLESLRQWDIVRVSGRLRVIREVHVSQGTKRRSFTFAILNCSWTGKAYTVYSIYDLARARIELVGRNYKPKSEIEKRLQADIEKRTGPYRFHELDCCEIKGIT